MAVTFFKSPHTKKVNVCTGTPASGFQFLGALGKAARFVVLGERCGLARHQGRVG